MQQRPGPAPSAGFNLVIAAALGIFGLIALIDGVNGDGPGSLLKGGAMTAYAAVLLRDALHIKKTGQPSMSRKRMNIIGLACLALYFVGVMVRRGPEMASFFG